MTVPPSPSAALRVAGHQSVAPRPRGPGELASVAGVRRRERGQASVELLALLPLTLIVGLAVLALLAARSAAGQATAAAQAGAMALIQDADAAAAARAALPASARERASVRISGRAVTVTVRPASQVAFLAGRLSHTSTAYAGPPPQTTP